MCSVTYVDGEKKWFCECEARAELQKLRENGLTESQIDQWREDAA